MSVNALSSDWKRLMPSVPLVLDPSFYLYVFRQTGVRLDDDDESNAAFASSSFTPLFSTQPPEASVISNGGNVSRNGRLSADLPETDRASSSAGSTVNGLRNGTSRSTVNGRRPSGGLPSVRASKGLLNSCLALLLVEPCLICSSVVVAWLVCMNMHEVLGKLFCIDGRRLNRELLKNFY